MKFNAVVCTQCGTLLFSRHRHDFRKCDCDNGTFVDGGLDYQRIGGKDLAKIIPISEIKDVSSTKALEVKL